jgi:hypothetical protein
LFGAILASLSLPMVKALMTEKKRHIVKPNLQSYCQSVDTAAKRFQKWKEIVDIF